MSVGYKVKSKNGVIFRKWANKILNDYMIKGYAVNQKEFRISRKKQFS
ncbi:MAG: virulence RhuM family protein [Clostridium sp.]|nr:MAG: virulence RhuM family protein [Clostridium sp.]